MPRMALSLKAPCGCCAQQGRSSHRTIMLELSFFLHSTVLKSLLAKELLSGFFCSGGRTQKILWTDGGQLSSLPTLSSILLSCSCQDNPLYLCLQPASSSFCWSLPCKGPWWALALMHRPHGALYRVMEPSRLLCCFPLLSFNCAVIGELLFLALWLRLRAWSDSLGVPHSKLLKSSYVCALCYCWKCEENAHHLLCLCLAFAKEKTMDELEVWPICTLYFYTENHNKTKFLLPGKGRAQIYNLVNYVSQNKPCFWLTLPMSGCFYWVLTNGMVP